MLRHFLDDFMSFVPLQMPQLLNVATMEEPQFYGDYVLLTFPLRDPYDLEEVMDIFEDDMELITLYHHVPVGLEKSGHSTCAYSNPAFGQMFKMNARTDADGKVNRMSGQDWQSIHLPPNGCPRSCRRSWSYRPCRRVLASRILRSYPHLRVTSSERRGKCASDRPRCVGSPDRSPGERFAAYRGRYPFSRNRVQTSPAYPCPADRTSECCSPQCRTVGCPAGVVLCGFPVRE